MSDPIHDHAQLIAETQWVRRLAHRLVNDPDVAEDLAQATCAAAIEHRPEPLTRGWLATVLRNLTSHHQRREGQRREREAMTAKSITLPSTQVMVEKVQSQRRVAEAVLALDEPYRTVVLWRFFEDLPPREIAARRAVPVATVDSQIQRGLAQLRGKLDAEFGNRKTWLLALVPLTPRGSSLSIPIGALLMKAKALSAVAAILLAIMGYALWPDSKSPSPAKQAAAASTNTVRDAKTSESDLGQRNVVVPQSDSPSKPLSRKIQGAAFDASGAALPDLRVKGEAVATSDESGAFEVAMTDKTQVIHSNDTEWTTVIAGIVSSAATRQEIAPVVVVAPNIAFAGIVLDEGGDPLEDVIVKCSLPSGFTTRITAPLDSSRPMYRSWSVRTGADGSFVLKKIGQVEGAKLLIRKNGFLPHEFDQPAHARDDLQITLKRPEADEDLVRGQVVDMFGRSVPSAHVSLGNNQTKTDGQGLFTLSRKRSRGLETIQALKRGFLPGRAELPSPEETLAFVYVTMGAEPLEIRGRVIDSQGRPVVNARVWNNDAELVTGLGGSLSRIEDYLGGGLTDPELSAKFTVNGRRTESMGDLKEKHSSSMWAWTRTDTHGRFVLGGMQRRSYSLRVLVEGSLGFFDTAPILAGSPEVTISFRPQRHAVVAGHVFDPQGRPVADAEVELRAWAIQKALEFPDGSETTGGDAVVGPKIRTGSDGSFRFEQIGRAPIFFVVLGDHVMNDVFGLQERGIENATDRPIDDLVLTVSRRYHLRLELADTSRADSFGIVDAAGKRLELAVFDDGGKNSSQTVKVHGGKTRVYAVPEDTSSVVLFRAKELVETLPIRLELSGVTIIR